MKKQIRTRPLITGDKIGIQLLIRDAFSGYPWYQDYLQDDLDNLWKVATARPGFKGIVALDENNTITGASWWYLPTDTSIRGETLSKFIRHTKGDRVLVWEDAILVLRKSQGLGVGSVLRNMFIVSVKNTHKQALIISRIRDDNVPSILLAERIGFKRTGAKFKESKHPHVSQEYWYLLL
jgi:hypothetical protein